MTLDIPDLNPSDEERRLLAFCDGLMERLVAGVRLDRDGAPILSMDEAAIGYVRSFMRAERAIGKAEPA